MYTIRLNGQVIAHTDWSPLAQAAWHRASRDRDSAQHGGIAELWKDDSLLLRVKPETLRGHRWPDGNDCELRDVLKALLLLLRDDEWDAKELAAAMTEFGLPTTRGRIDALRGSTQGKRAEVTAAEITTLIFAVLHKYRTAAEQPG